MKAAAASLHTRPVVLVVDDQPASLHLLSAAISDECDVVVATSAEQALALCRKDAPDLVLMDVVMPGIDGLRCCELLHSEPGLEDLPVIFVTASGSQDDEAACWEAGGVDFIGKPASPLTVRKRVAVHLRLKLMADQLRRISVTDELTGIANRRGFRQSCAPLWEAARRDGSALSLLLVDVDWFKAFNDHYGHPEGDVALRAVARELSGVLRGADDVVARVGGEEFAIVLPQSDVQSAEALGRRIMAAFTSLAKPHAGAPGGTLSVSVGSATAPVSELSNLRWFMQRADENLYAAKEAGRGRFVGTALIQP